MPGILDYKNRVHVVLAVLLSVPLRLIGQILSGVMIFGDYAWEGWGDWGYSIVFHLTAKIPEMILTILILTALPLERLSQFALRGLYLWEYAKVFARGIINSKDIEAKLKKIL